MTILTELKQKLSTELKKPKSNRNIDLIKSIQTQIHEEKKELTKGFKKRQKDKEKEKNNLMVSLWEKKNDFYGKIKSIKKEEKLEHEKRQREKLQPNKTKK